MSRIEEVKSALGGEWTIQKDKRGNKYSTNGTYAVIARRDGHFQVDLQSLKDGKGLPMMQKSRLLEAAMNKLIEAKVQVRDREGQVETISEDYFRDGYKGQDGSFVAWPNIHIPPCEGTAAGTSTTESELKSRIEVLEAKLRIQELEAKLAAAQAKTVVDAQGDGTVAGTDEDNPF